jgi:hypothetical protein
MPGDDRDTTVLMGMYFYLIYLKPATPSLTLSPEAFPPFIQTMCIRHPNTTHHVVSSRIGFGYDHPFYAVMVTETSSQILI